MIRLDLASPWDYPKAEETRVLAQWFVLSLSKEETLCADLFWHQISFVFLLPFTSVITRRILNRNFMIIVWMWPRSSILCFRQRRSNGGAKVICWRIKSTFLPSLCGCHKRDEKFCKPSSGGGKVRWTFNLVKPQQRLSEKKAFFGLVNCLTAESKSLLKDKV